MGLSEPLLYSQVLSYLKILSQKGISMRILSFEKDRLLTKEEENFMKKDLKNAGIRWTFLRYHKRLQFLSKPYDIIKGLFFVFYISLKENMDVIHARGTFCALLGIIPCLFLRKKMIFDMRGLMAEEYLDAGLWKKNSLNYKFINKLEEYFIKRAAEVIVITNKANDLLAKRGRLKNVTVIPTCVDLGRFSLKKDYLLNNRFVLIYTGSLGTWYMISEMIDFYRELAGFYRDSAFFVLSQTEKTWIERYIPPKLKDRVIIDSVKPEKVPYIMASANAGIFFIKPCFSKTFSNPTKFGEYLACGLPVVINKGIGDTEEIVKENRIGAVVENFNVQEYRKAIVEIRRLLEEGHALRDRCRNTAEKYFSLKEGAEKYHNIYTRMEGALKCG